jgi:hypothetical protein
MSKLVNISIDVTKIPREKIIAHKNGGKYVSLDIWLNDDPDQYGKDCSVNINQTKEERDRKDSKVYCGNGKKLFGFGESNQHKNRPTTNQPSPVCSDDDDSIPF